jgi:hypothetical protein
MQAEPVLEEANFYAPPGYHIRSCGVQSRRQLLFVELERQGDGWRLELSVDISGFADEPNHWRWLKDVIDLEALWAAS